MMMSTLALRACLPVITSLALIGGTAATALAASPDQSRPTVSHSNATSDSDPNEDCMYVNELWVCLIPDGS